MQSTTVARWRAPALPHLDWLGYSHALLRSAYALLLILVMLLPANFVAYAICLTLYRNEVAASAHTAGQHLSGNWLLYPDVAFSAGTPLWGLATFWGVLFWASCLSAVITFALWSVRALVQHLPRHHRPRLSSARAGGLGGPRAPVGAA